MNDETKSKARQLYRFLKEANQLRFRPVRSVGDQPKTIRLAEMPAHESVQFIRPVHDDSSQEAADVLIRVKRPVLTRCPAPPETVEPWLLPGWDDPAKAADVADSRNIVVPSEDGKGGEETVTIRFEDDEERFVDWETWMAARDAWTAPERAARRAMWFFEAFYEIHSTLEKDGEQLELLAADGRLSWQAVSALDGRVSIDHPILLKRVELRFDPNVPEFTVHETDREPEIYGALFVDLHDVEPAAIRGRKSELDTAGYHPFGWGDTEVFLRAFIQTVSPLAGEFLDEPGGSPTETPRLWRDPLLVLRKRILGIANAVDAILDDIENRELFPPALAQITGTDEAWVGSGFGDSSSSGGTTVAASAAINDDDILLAKEANEEQMQIIRRLERSGSVIVQGPPGTGKTHTIGNLIGHLLAQGKSILVTAQTAKALRVLRDKVPETLRPLCVSVLGSDQDARSQLESSIGSITERLTSDTAETLTGKARTFGDERRKLLSSSRELAHKLKEALENEYREISVGGKRYLPSDAAKFVAANEDKHSWLPSPVKLGSDIGLSEEEIVRLYALGATLTAQEEQDARCPLPDLAALPSERQFLTMVSEYRDLLTRDISEGVDRWRQTNGPSDELEEIAKELAAEFSDDLLRQAWRPRAIVAGMRGGAEREAWELLVASIERAAEANGKHSLVLRHRPRLSESMPVHKQRQVVAEITEHLGNGGKLGFLHLATRSEWRQFIKTVSVSAGQPSHAEHFDAIGRLAELESSRLELEDLWNALVGQHSGTLFASMSPNPEMSCRALIPEMRRCLDWHSKVWEPLAAKLKAAGLKLDEMIAAQPREASQTAEYLLIERLASGILPQLLASEAARRRLKECEVWFEHLANLSAQIDPSAPDRGCAGRLVAAARSLGPEGYASALEYARRLHSVKPLVEERGALLAKMRLCAPGCAEQIAHRVPPHDGGAVPGDFRMAWAWRQLHDELAERDKLDAQELQHEIDRARDTLRQITQWLIESKAWGKQLERLQGNNTVRQALVGWLDTAKRLVSTKQADKRQTLLTEGRKLMRRCSEAVPVWIMPIPIMAESFDPRTTRFDVVIIDEASQADLNALIPLYMGKQIVVVGDHEQVTPLGVGKDQTILENLRKSMLQDIPNSHLFDNLSSIYDIGRQSFGDAVRLVEHFRCVPEIIAFSNQLSYDGKIQPLREANSTNLKPACVARRVDGFRENDVNRKEAENIISTIKAMVRHPAYVGKTIGVISMIGDSQAALIQTMLHKEIDGVELETRRIQAGISGEFQGDERDVIFLSMVDSSPEEGTLRATGAGAFEQTKKRYNVAASRARDQLWVVHSFDPSLNLKSTDLRFQLLRHVKDPQATLRAFDREERKTESPFEREVLKRLTGSGYLVRTQWQVGYFRIDMVVEGGGKRLAVECDGDRWHPLEKLSEDMERQAILERLGWQFVRIRGSAFYRNPEQAMRPVFQLLAEMEIPQEAFTPGEASTSNMTLIHELDDIIAEGFDEDEQTAPAEQIATTATDPAEPDAFAASLESIDFDHGLVEAFLGRAGGIAPLETFLREMAKSKGFQRLGKNVRKGLEAELAKLRRQGKIAIEGGVIRLV